MKTEVTEEGWEVGGGGRAGLGSIRARDLKAILQAHGDKDNSNLILNRMAYSYKTCK